MHTTPICKQLVTGLFPYAYGDPLMHTVKVVITMGITVCIRGDIIHLIPVCKQGSPYAYGDLCMHTGIPICIRGCPICKLSNGDGGCKGNIKVLRTGLHRTFVNY